jgi:tetratricopeptide (TPR) repeat protein
LQGKNKTAELMRLMQSTLTRYKDLPAPAQYRSQRALLEAATENNLGDASYYVVNPQTGVSHYLRARALMQAARADGVIDMRIPMREAYYDYQLSASYQDMKQPKLALDWAERGKGVIDALSRYDDSTSTAHIATMLSLQRASVLGDLGRASEALQEAEDSVARRRATLAKHPEDMDNRLSLASALHTLAKYHLRAEAAPRACDAARESLEIFGALARNGGVPERNRILDVAPQEDFVARCPK